MRANLKIDDVGDHSSQRCIRSFQSDDGGATSIEYSLIVALIFLAIVASVTSFSDANTLMYKEIESAIDNAGS